MDHDIAHEPATKRRKGHNVERWLYFICTILNMLKPHFHCYLTITGKIFISGGFNGQECLSSAEYYDPATNTWTMIAPMRNRRSGVGVVAQGGCLYAVGGFNGITRMNNGEKWSPDTNTWTNIAEMYSPRSNFGIEVSYTSFLYNCQLLSKLQKNYFSGY